MTNSEDRHKTGILSVCLNPPVSILHWMMCILSLDRPVLRKWFHVWIIFTFFAGLLVIVCDIIPLLRWYILLFIFHFHQCIFISNMAINSMCVIHIAHAMWMKGNALLFIHKMKKKWNFIVNVFEHVADVRIWIFVFKCRWISYLQPVQYFYSTWSFFSVTIVFIDYFISPHGGKFCWILIK